MTDILINTQTYRHTQKHNTKRLRYVTTLQDQTSHKYRHTHNKHCSTGNTSHFLIFLYPVLSCHHELFTGTMKHFLLIEFCDRIQCCGLGGVWVWVWVWVWGWGKGYGVQALNQIIICRCVSLMVSYLIRFGAFIQPFNMEYGLVWM